MTPSSGCVDLITSFETFQGRAYKPTPKDVWTLGYGHTHGVREGDTCTAFTAELWLRDDLGTACRAIDAFVKSELSQPRYDALASLVFNIGVGAFEKSTLLKCLNAEAWAEAADEFLKWDHQAGVELPGLKRRREAERKLFLS